MMTGPRNASRGRARAAADADTGRVGPVLWSAFNKFDAASNTRRWPSTEAWPWSTSGPRITLLDQEPARDLVTSSESVSIEKDSTRQSYWFSIQRCTEGAMGLQLDPHEKGQQITVVLRGTHECGLYDLLRRQCLNHGLAYINSFHSGAASKNKSDIHLLHQRLLLPELHPTCTSRRLLDSAVDPKVQEHPSHSHMAGATPS
ncbi:hypothetical protein EDB87DRAFT_1756186 [Lactarius vividus]|nr:hypothetical protein EDB87DRAFT_1756186 [Lactarius vividus]